MNDLVRTQASPNALINKALTDGASVETLERLFQLQKDWEANEARKAFVSAMVNFKSTPITIVKAKLVSFQTDKGITSYHHAELSDVTKALVPVMAENGLSHRWTVEQKDADITVTCEVTHSLGHSEKVAITARPDTSGGKNAIQAIASAISYLQRYTLLAATGQSTGGDDDDGHGSELKFDQETADLMDKAEGYAAHGTDALKAHWKSLTDAQRTKLAPYIEGYKEQAAKVVTREGDEQ